ncbi:hypothetical protein GCM10023187_37420 [Nibrella viscosa]|uniref:IPT/TIG domain-containing protein n=1 Tax=Nibrella viscosa TaxID=1084524 RepID=A0ABP8KN58_9BACT
MKFIQKWQSTLLLLLGLTVAFTACKNDTEPEAVLSITSVNPTTAPIGSTITITGTQFNSTPASNTVTFGGNAIANVVTASPTQLVVTVPSNAQNGPITVMTGAGRSAISTQTFTLGARPVVQVQGEITTNTTWTRNNVYLLRGFVYVTNGAVLTIESGTLIKGGEPSTDPAGQQRGGTLIIEKGGRIEARGTAAQPIVFTSNRPAGQRGYGDWGGVVLVGRAPHNRPAATTLEGGIRGTMGTDAIANDNSGTLQYVRIEFAGIALTNANNSEINGLTLYAVGSGTTIDHVQVSYSGDDAYEWFGGTVNAKYLVAHRTFDDDWDTDWGYTGRVQFAVSLRDPAIADQSFSNGFESDNFNPGEPATAANAGLPLTAPIFANVSNFAFSGAPSTAFAAPASGAYQSAMHLRRNTAISIYNSVFVGYPEGLRLDGTATLANATAGTLDLRGITLANVGIANSTTSIPVRGAGGITDAQAQEFFNATARNNQVIPSASLATLLLNANNFSLTNPNFLPQTGSPLLQGAVTGGKLADSFFTATTYRGAFGTENWTQGWTNWDPQNTNYN